VLLIHISEILSATLLMICLCVPLVLKQMYFAGPSWFKQSLVLGLGKLKDHKVFASEVSHAGTRQVLYLKAPIACKASKCLKAPKQQLLSFIKGQASGKRCGMIVKLLGHRFFLKVSLLVILVSCCAIPTVPARLLCSCPSC